MEIDFIAKFIGAIGLAFTSWAVLVDNEKKQDWLFLLGGAGLLAYSIYLKDPIFIPLQIIFMAVTGWELRQIITGRKK